MSTRRTATRSATKKAAAKKAATKKAGAKKAATKKAATKKAAAKKAAAKTVATKKTATKKAPAKTLATKKAATRKAPAKTLATKKAATKKAPAKTVATKKAAAKKVAAKKVAKRGRAVPLSKAVADARAQATAARALRKAEKRSKARRREEFFQETHGEFDPGVLTLALNEVLTREEAPAGRRRRRAPQAFPTTAGAADRRWVPIGPMVTRRGQAMSRPRTSGRIRDLAVSPDGQRAYALSAKGGLWYSGDAGAAWAPVGGWARHGVNPQGNGNRFSGGALLVDFTGNTIFTDFVMVGTGEPVPWLTETGSSAQGGIGVLVALGPASDPIQADPWEPDTGSALFNGVGVRRLARHPAAISGNTAGPQQDRVLAATSDGLYLGTRAVLPAVPAAPPVLPSTPPQVALPQRDGFTWAQCAAAPKGAGNDVTDALWLTNGAGTRIVYALGAQGVFFSDDNGVTPNAIAALQAPGVAFTNRITMALVPGTNRVYVLAEIATGVANQFAVVLFRINDVIAAPQAVVAMLNVPQDLFGGPVGPTQAFYDHALAVELVGANDRIYLGGSTVQPRGGSEAEWSGSLFCFESPAPPAALAGLTAVANISRAGNPPAGDAGDRNGLIGNNVHADIHSIQLAGPAAPNRHVWVGCDGGVYVSEHSGRVNTFGSRNTGLATLEPIFLASHPTSSHFMMVGFQDNGSQVRVGDTVWEETFLGDGGGTVFHPIRSDIVVTQWTQANWNGAPASDYIDPISRSAGQAQIAGGDPENAASAFYSGAAVVADTAATGRLALGTNRVWLTDNLGTGAPVRWRTLPAVAGVEQDARNPSAPAFGVPFAAGNSVIDMVWQNGTTLLVIYQGGIVRYTNTNKATGTWTVQTWPMPIAGGPAAPAALTAVATLPAPSLDFYVATLGDPANTATETLWFFDNATVTFRATRLRRALDFTGPPVVPGPLDPCFAVVVDPIVPTNVYAGTATGVWLGQRQVAGNWNWSPFMNGLPEATVQDLEIWQDPAAPGASPRLLRAGVQSRGVWEVDLTQAEPRRTYIRVHARDDRRRFPTPMANPRRRPGTTPEVVSASPDIVVRPRWPVAAPPRFHTTITFGNAPAYDLWTFQTAFRWLYPSCVPDGQFNDAMRDLVRFHRQVLGLPPGNFIDKALWDRVVGDAANAQPGVRLLPDPIFSDVATVTSNVADARAVYRAPWQTAASFSAPATEIDLLETVLPPRATGSEWTVFREPSTVDVLLHHRDSRPVNAPGGFAVLLWRTAPTAAALLATGAADVWPFLAGVLAAGIAGAPPPGPAGWQIATRTNGAAMHTLSRNLDARIPRAVPIDVDLSGVPAGHRVMFLAMVGSTADDPIAGVVGAPANVGALVQAWPHAAMRIVRVTNRS